jgi:hypothetical protein
MKIYPRAHSRLVCGHWNGSPLEIGLTGHLRAIPEGDVYHPCPAAPNWPS